MHKNTPVVDLVIDADSGVIGEIGQIHNLAHLPVGTTWVSGSNKGTPERKKLNDWWVGRSIPASRENIQEALLQMHVLQATELLAKCYGLSLSDQYWICPENSGLKWGDINFFENDFSKDVGEILFGHELADRDKIDLMSPDNTSDGWLKKKWIIADGKRLLMKGGSGPYQQEPLGELIACAVMKRLEIPHIPYTLTFEAGEPYSLCETFVTPTTELVAAYRVWGTKKQDNRDSSFSHLLHCANDIGIQNVQASLEKMLVLDYIIANTDRHYNNFGFMRNAETLEWHGMAPIYDSGTALWHDTQFVGRPAKSKPFRSTHAEQIKLVKDFSWFDYRVLHDLGDECREIFAKSELIDEKRRDALVRAVEARAREIAQMRDRSFDNPSLDQRLAVAKEKSKTQSSTQTEKPPKKDERY